MISQIFSARARSFRVVDERFIEVLIRKSLVAEGEWKSRCHFLPNFGWRIDRPDVQLSLSFPEDQSLHGFSWDQNRIHYRAGLSESHRSRKPAAHRTDWPER